MDEEKSTTLVDFIEDYVDIKRLAEVILEEAEGITVIGFDIEPYKMIFCDVMDHITFMIEFEIAQIQARRAKIEAEERKLERLEEQVEKGTEVNHSYG